MAKYFFNEDRMAGKELWLALIANELAEANRLKRLEIDIHLTIAIDPGQLSSIDTKDVLKDKA